MIKCVIWDLDNTLWNGILSEEPNVILKEEMIEMVKLFHEKGIVNSICSKNDFSFAHKKLIELNIWQYFILPQINWEDKSKNINKILSNLHFREDNTLFVDDNQFEIDEVINLFPNIMTCNAFDMERLTELKNNLAEIQSSFARERIEMYRLEEKRINDEDTMSLSKEEFLVNCDIKISIKNAVINDLQRLSELIDRTNQINSTGIRYSEDIIIEMMKNNNVYDVFVAEISDKYGSYGKSGLIIAKKNEEDYEVLLLIVSCRLMGKGIPQALMNHIYYIAKKKGYKNLKCLFKKNKFNRQMILLYTMNGFKKRKTEDLVDEYYLDISCKEILKPVWTNMNYIED